MKFHQVTRETLAGNRGKKGCETNCGVDCVLNTSLPFSNRAHVAGVEARDVLIQLSTKVGLRRAAASGL
jgi:hypothetical protein